MPKYLPTPEDEGQTMPWPFNPAVPKDPSGVPPKIPKSPMILVVEDDEAVRKMLDCTLRNFGFSVILSASGEGALDIFQRETIDVVLMDVQMRGMDGPTTLAALKKRDPKAICCFMSGHTGQYTAEDLWNMGAAGVIPKPFHLDDLKQMLLIALEGKSEDGDKSQ
jgi:DNA-binding NtrC family response regulator